MPKSYTKSPEAVARLTHEQYRVTQEDGTEPAFHNEFSDHKEAGLYVDVVSGEPLFSSKDKYDSRSGWPSFTRPVADNITERSDNRHGMTRVEARSKHANSHLGHVFSDGPQESTGLRYCINSAALRFIPVDKLAEEGYQDYVDHFEDTPPSS